MSWAQGDTSRGRLTTLVARREYLRTVRRRGYIFGTLLLPLGIAVLMGISVFFSTSGFETSSEASGTIVVVNDSDVAISDFQTDRASLRTASQQDAAAQLEDGEISEYYVVPATFREEGVDHARRDRDRPRHLAPRGRAEQRGAAALHRPQRPADRGRRLARYAARILQGVTVNVVTVEGDEVSGADIAAGFALPMVFVAIFMISIFMTSGYLLQSVTEEKENRVVEIVLSSVPATPLMAGKILGLGGAGLTQVGIWVGSALIAVPLLSSQIPDLGRIELDPTMLMLALAYFVLGYLAFGAIFAAIGAIAPGNREAQQYSGFLGFAAAMPFIVFSRVPRRPAIAGGVRAGAVPADRADIDAHRAGHLRADPLAAGGRLARQPDAVRVARDLGLSPDLPCHRAALWRRGPHCSNWSARSAHHADPYTRAPSRRDIEQTPRRGGV